MSAQKPLQRAYQRDPQAVAQWQSETYPAIARAAKKTGADILFWDESRFRADAVHGKTWGVKGQTPVVQRPGQRQSISAASAVSAKGAFWFITYEGGLTGELGDYARLRIGLPGFGRARDLIPNLFTHSGLTPYHGRY